MLKRADDLKGLEIEIELSEQEQSELATIVRTQGFNVMQRLMEDQVRRFNMKLINTPVTEPENVIARHSIAKGVAQFYMGLMERIETELQIQRAQADTLGTAANPENHMNIEEVS